uniref:6-carboxytetrahydropterin synthase QueD n=1 Tax=Archaeoglobus fulgidus TaxID=2234 RepID=A0A7C2NFD8_ARCFL
MEHEMIIGVSTSFSAAHSIPGHAKCGKIHGHNFRVEVEISGKVGENGMVMDFFDLKKIVNEVVSKFDHTLLNEQIKIPTSENICLKIFEELVERGLKVRRVRVAENEDKWAELRF